MEFYIYPANRKISPFESVNGDNYFVYCTKFSYLGSFDEIGNICNPSDKRNALFTGAWVLNIFKRLAVVENERLIFINKNFNDGHIIGASRLKNLQYAILTSQIQEYEIPSWRTQVLKTYAIHDDDNPLQLKLFLDADSAIQYAILLSKKQNIKCIVAQWFADIDRH